MNTDLKYRFDEIITAIRLAPDMNDDNHNSPEDWAFPDLTKGLSSPEMVGAILCQTFKEDDEFAAKLMTMLTATFTVSMNNKEQPNDDDLHTLAVAVNVMWAKGAITPLFVTLGMLAKVANEFDMEVPELASVILRGNGHASKFGVLDPYNFFDDDVPVEDMAKTLMETLEQE